MIRYLLKYGITILLAFQVLATNALEAGAYRKSQADKTISILAIGNSFTVNACKFLSEITHSARGYEIQITRATIGGASLGKHAGLIAECEKDDGFKPYADQYTLKELLQKEEYDFVTIQQVSSLSFKEESYQPYTDMLVNFIRENAPSAQIIVHQTWAYSPDSKRLVEFGVLRAEMHDGLVKAYQSMADFYGFEILPSGNAFYSSYKQHPEIHLWKEDGYHANINGEYLAGLIWFGKLFNTSPKKVRYIPEGINQKFVKLLKDIADRQIKNLELQQEANQLKN